MKQLDAFLDVPPPPPSGPAKEVARFCGSTYEGYVWWRTQSTDGRRTFAYVERTALDLAARGDARISINRLVEQARASLHLEINNTWRSLMADDLVARHPHLVDVIERRKRRKFDHAA